ncbi:trehalose operon repressor [Lactococcus termiticola]|uniref:Trehalose operon repressor n=1 Tax=Lactococcus termiticola TaxID=2169526 RepID=A0A2R5HFE6_9LACT|nr:trehalose operon repressor [Lactococcus termiticola]GBG96025.1 GntR family transcriptional regulator [Lactococcus termiticola]
MKKYEKIASILEQEIFKDVYKENELLPSEHQLTELYGASRQTVRTALKLLEDKGLIQRRQGFGSIVIAHDKLRFPISGLTSYKELQESMGFVSETEVVSFETITIDEKLEKLTQFPLGSEVFRILRQRKIDGKAYVLDLDYLRKDRCPELSPEIAKDSIYQYLENVLGLHIAYAQKEITVDFVHDDDRKYLDLGQQDRHVVSIKSQVFLFDNSLFQYTESRHQVDKFRFTEFARRQKR